ncbi:OmpA-like domain-containing protein [Desulfonema limicola]|uniref:OmpA-like domain-containing protein n=1 Tax=Desulfonema limicola TaxID=45656 RepID=A0A975GIT1_9BACT|nr:OmpA family protein [Desulfonema limicola]QTA82887.1 OmpA-like domain-containing protein [Desulfonema limicola]
MKKLLSLAGLSFIIIIFMTGCASRGYVDKQLSSALTSEITNIRSEVNENIEDVRKNVEATQEEIKELKAAAQKQQEKIDEKLSLVQDAIVRAEEAHKLAKGKLLYEVTISDESVPFSYKKSELSEDAKAELDIFAKVLIEENNDVYIEIQGHTDNIGSEKYNLELGQARADSVKAYLHTQHNIPLHKLNSFSYGKSMPVAPNDTETGRAKNRRVVLMVME